MKANFSLIKKKCISISVIEYKDSIIVIIRLPK